MGDTNEGLRFMSDYKFGSWDISISLDEADHALIAIVCIAFSILVMTAVMKENLSSIDLILIFSVLIPGFATVYKKTVSKGKKEGSDTQDSKSEIDDNFEGEDKSQT
jgi:hypothetical protein